MGKNEPRTFISLSYKNYTKLVSMDQSPYPRKQTEQNGGQVITNNEANTFISARKKT